MVFARITLNCTLGCAWVYHRRHETPVVAGLDVDGRRHSSAFRARVGAQESIGPAAVIDWRAIAGLNPPRRLGDPGSERRLTAEEYETALRAAHQRAQNLKGWVAFLACALGYVVLRYFGL